MKNQTLFSLKDKRKKLKCHLLQFLFGALRVKMYCEFSLPYLGLKTYSAFGLPCHI